MTLPLLLPAIEWEYQLLRSVINVSVDNVVERTTQISAETEKRKKMKRNEASEREREGERLDIEQDRVHCID